MGSPYFPVLPVLEELRARLSKFTVGKLDDVGFVCVQHLLETTGSLLECLIQMGARPGNIFVVGKCYSTNQDTLRRLRRLGVRAEGGRKPDRFGCFTRALERDVAELWDTAVEKAVQRRLRSFVVLDDGGHCLALIPPAVRSQFVISGVEQTTRGYRIGARVPAGFPIIQVARSAAKQHIEPPMISEAVLNKVNSSIPVANGRLRCGVIGLGRIGQAVATHLVRLGHTVHVADLSEALSDTVQGALWCETAQEVLGSTDLIFGCTGRDVFGRARYGSQDLGRWKKAKWLKKLSGEKTLASCSTGDIEFLALLKTEVRNSGEAAFDSLGSACVEKPNATWTILRGGFPVNFDGSPESVSSGDIQMTRGLLLCGIVQALLARGRKRVRGERWEKLDPAMQRFVVGTWLRSRESRRQWYPEAIMMGFMDRSWIQSHSHGYDAHYPALAEAFGD